MNRLMPGKIEELFNKIAPRYDFLNDLLSFGLHRIWKRKLLKFLQPIPGEKWIDLCCGTGDLTVLIARYLKPKGNVLGIDFSSHQLALAKKRVIKEKEFQITFIKQDVLENCLPRNSFNGVVMAYGLRNLSNTKEGIKEVYRLLKPGGRAGILDFNSFENGSINPLFQKVYLRLIVVPIASLFKLKKEYEYIESSLQNFPNGTVQKQIAIDAGFENVRYQLLARGQMGILLMEKPRG